MSEPGEVREGPELNPVQKQTQLKSIYASIPETSALAANQEGPGQFTFNIPSSGITPEEQSKRLPEDVKSYMNDSITRKELPQLKLAQLQSLLADTKIMPILKSKIEQLIKGYFAFGITRKTEEAREDSVLRLIGVTSNTNSPEGIFSLDPSTRAEIDRGYLKIISGWIEQKKGFIDQSIKDGKDHRVPIFEEAIKSLERDLELGKEQYQSLYQSQPILE